MKTLLCSKNADAFFKEWLTALNVTFPLPTLCPHRDNWRAKSPLPSSGCKLSYEAISAGVEEAANRALPGIGRSAPACGVWWTPQHPNSCAVTLTCLLAGANGADLQIIWQSQHAYVTSCGVPPLCLGGAGVWSWHVITWMQGWTRPLLWQMLDFWRHLPWWKDPHSNIFEIWSRRWGLRDRQLLDFEPLPKDVQIVRATHF